MITVCVNVPKLAAWLALQDCTRPASRLSYTYSRAFALCAAPIPRLLVGLSNIRRSDDELDAQRIALFSACLPGWDARRVIDIAVSLGLSTVEWAIGPREAIESPEAGRQIRELCERAGLRSVGLSVQDHEVTLATPHLASRYVDLAVVLGAPHVRLFAPSYKGGSLRREQQRVRDGLDCVIDIAAPQGLAVLVETSPTTLAPAPDFAAVLVEQHPPQRAGVLYDPGNMAIEGSLAPGLTVGRLGRHLRHVHVKNVAWFRHGGTWRWCYDTLAAGLLDWREILQTLATARYEGSFAIDHLSGKPTPALLRTESDHLRSLVAEASVCSTEEDHALRIDGQRAATSPPVA